MGDEGNGDVESDDEEQPFHLPLFEVISTEGIVHLRTETRELYYDNKWHSDESIRSVNYQGGEIKYDLDVYLSGQGKLGVQTIEPLEGFLPVVSYTTHLDTPVSGLRCYLERQAFFSDSPVTGRYKVYFNLYDFTASQNASTLPDRQVFDWVDMKPGGPFPEIAHQIAGLTETFNTYQVVGEIEDYLQKNYRYSHSILTSPAYENIEQFLLGDKAGSVLDFNSSLVFMARELLIPARLVYGYRIDPGEKYQVVYKDQAYVYGEVYLDNRGWIAFDLVPDYRFYQPPEPTTTRITEINDTIIKGESLSISGEVVNRLGHAVDGLPVLIYLKENLGEERLSYSRTEVVEGNFAAEFTVDRDISVGHAHVLVSALENDLYSTSQVDTSLVIFSETNLELSMPRLVFLGSSISIRGRLTEKVTPVPLPFETVELSVKSKTGEQILLKDGLSDEEGFFEFGLQADFFEPEQSLFSLRIVESRPIKGLVFFNGDEFYFPSEAAGETAIWIFYWRRALMLLAFLLVICAGAAAAFKYRLNLRGQEEEPAETGSEKSITASFSSDEYPLVISFPGIKEPFPPVWGLSERLTIEISPGNNEFPADKSLQVVYGDAERTDIVLRGTTLTEHCFTAKGLYQVTVEEPGGTAVYGFASLKIVDYREEIIEMARLVFQLLRCADSSLSDNMTPRELLEKGLPDMVAIDSSVRRGMTSLLEHVIYSLKEITRSDYEAFYQLYISINTPNPGE